MAGRTEMKNKSIVIYNSDSDSESYDGDHLLSLEKLTLGPKKKLLILCLGGMLFHRVYRYDYHKIPKSRRHDAAYGSFLVYKRPFCDDFLKFCFERFEVGLWSSAREWYIDNALDCIMSGLRAKLAFIWDQTDCTDSGFKALDNINKPIYLKEMKKLWENEHSAAKGNGKGKYTPTNTLMIDDEPYKALLNPPNTAIFLPEYNADDANDTLLGSKGELRKYLDEVASCNHVPKYVKNHPFGKPAISPSHSDWAFYSKITTRLQKKMK